MEANASFKGNYSTIRKPEQFQFISYNNYETLRLSTLISQWPPKLKINQSDREKTDIGRITMKW